MGSEVKGIEALGVGNGWIGSMEDKEVNDG